MVKTLQKISVLIILLFFTFNCTHRNKIIGKITEPLDSSIVVTPAAIANYTDTNMFAKVFVKAFVSNKNSDKENHSWIKFWISKHTFVIAKPIDDTYSFPKDLSGNVVLQGKVRNYAEFQNTSHQKNQHRLLGKYWYINDYELLSSSENQCKYVLLVDHLNY
ncbi:MAG: hypothetical protein CFE21_03935 [Bacteroidetes bacterium B1(2017)]|nr:MAG: hypothetical protein CFE21_03935 [Bacteroidetes bacterium B1(2017)]